MALPQTFDPASPADSDSPAQGAAKLRDIIQKFVDVFGIPQSPSTVTAATTKIDTDGQQPSHVRLTNKTGSGLVAADVVTLDTANDKAVVAGNTVSSRKRFYVARETIGNNAEGLFVRDGLISAKSTGAIARGEYVRKSATALAIETTGVTQGDTTSVPVDAIGIAHMAASGGFCTVMWWGATGGAGGISNTQTFYDFLPIAQADIPDATGTINNPPEIVREVSTGAQTSNSPKSTRTYAKFDAATDEHLMWTRILPTYYASGGTIRINWKAATATSGNTVWKVSVDPTTDSSTDDDASVFNTATTVTSAAPGTQGQTVTATVTLTTTNMAANRKITVFIGRDADNGSDTMTGDAILTAATLEYTVTLS